MSDGYGYEREQREAAETAEVASWEADCDCGEATCYVCRGEGGEPEEEEMLEDDYELVARGDDLYLVDRFSGRAVHGPAVDRPALKALFDAGDYWPNVWTISDHGNVFLVTDWT